MDVVIPLGPNSIWGFNEIRYALRGIEKHCTEGYGNVFIIGEKPKFFEYGGRVHHIDYRPDYNDAKELRIWRKVLKACSDERVSEEFFFMNDDYFFLREFSMSDYPFYQKGNLKDFDFATQEMGNIKSGYARKSKRTLEVLESLNLGTWHFDVHQPTRVTKTDFLKCFSELKKFIEVDAKKPNGSLLIKTTYLNWLGVKDEFIKDLKISKLEDLFKADNPGLFSISDKAITKDFEKFMEGAYDKVPEFEKPKEGKVTAPRETPMRNKEEKVILQITTRFIDGQTNQQFGPGKWKLPKKMAERLALSGKGILSYTPEKPIQTTQPFVVSPKVTNLRELPENFPAREKLIEHGISTVEGLKEKGIEQKLSEIKGLGQATITKIGLALNEL